MSLLCYSLWFLASWAVGGLFVPPPPPLGGRISTAPDRGVLIDEDGRERIFHGTNVVYKGYPYAPPMFPIDTEMSFGEADMDRIASWGMNNVRLGVLWAGAEPEKGMFNYTYLAELRNIVDALGRRGIYTYLELHQDAWGERFCGDGFPTWAVDESVARSFPQPLSINPYAVNKSDGLPSEADCKRILWADYYTTRAIGAAFQNFYDNVGGVGDLVARLWREVALVFKNSTWLLGYELMNEPWAGDHWKDPSILYPGVADRKNMEPFYKKLASAIQEVDTDHLIMFEPIPWDNGWQVGFNATPIGDRLANQSVFAYHYYSPPDMMAPAGYLKRRVADAKRLRSAGFLTEFATTWNVPDKTAPKHDLRLSMDVIVAAENLTQSWSGWEYKVFHPSSGRHPMTPGDMSMFHPNGSLDLGTVSAVSQPYARAVAGTIEHNKFTAAKPGWGPFAGHASSYILQYTAKASCKLPTEVYVNEEMHFPDGITVTATPSHVGEVAYDAKAGLVQVTHGPDVSDGLLVTLEIHSKQRSLTRGNIETLVV